MDQTASSSSTTSSRPPPLPKQQPAAAPPPPKQEPQKQEEEEQQEEEGECGFCLFMKGGGCKEEFVAWEVCVAAAEESGEDVVEKCFQVTAALRKCMDAHADYYEPVLRAEKAMAEELEAQIQDENNKEAQIQDENKENNENNEGQIQQERKEKEGVDVGKT